MATGMRSVLAIALLALATQTAAADGVYFTESFGGTDVKDELAPYMSSAFRIRIAAGYRKNNLALELWFAGGVNTSADSYGSDGLGYEVTTPDGYKGTGYYGDYTQDSSTDFTSYGLDAKWLHPVAPNLDVYIRGGMSKGYADGLDAEGRGLGIGAGAQLKGKVPALGFLFWPFFFTNFGPKVTAAAFVDTTYEFYRLHGATRTTDAQLSHLTVGFAVGSDF
jgi:hypothetical protein